MWIRVFWQHSCISRISKGENKTATVFLFQCLAVADTIFLIFTASCNCTDAILQCADDTYSKFYRCKKQAYLCVYCDPFMQISHMTSVWITVFLGIIRYTAVCYPFDVKSIFSIAKVKFICLLTIVLFVIFESLFMATQRVDETKDIATNETCNEMGRGNKVTYNYFTLTYLYGFKVGFHYLIPLCILTFIKFKIIHALRTGSKDNIRQTSNRNKQRSRKTTLILVVILMIFLMCYTPFPVQKILFVLDLLHGTAEKLFFFASRTFIVINSGINLIVYTSFNKRYRKLMLMNLCKQSENTDERSNTVPQTSSTAQIHISTKF